MTQTAIIVGASRGLGLLTARRLASQGWTVVATGRDLSEVTQSDCAARILPVELDLNALDNVGGFGQWLSGCQLPPVKALVLNAGTQSYRRTWSDDGYEATFAVNYLAPLLLIDRLLPCLTPGSRIVWTASGTHNPAQVKLLPAAMESASPKELLHPDPHPAHPFQDGFARYATSKLAVVRAVPILARELAPLGLKINAFDPGLMPGTGLAREAPATVRHLLTALGPLTHAIPGAHRPTTSARHLADLVTSPRYQHMSGAYVVDHEPAGTSVASHDLIAGPAFYRDALRTISSRRLGQECAPRP